MIDFDKIDEQDTLTEYQCSAGQPCMFCELPMDIFAYRQICANCEVEVISFDYDDNNGNRTSFMCKSINNGTHPDVVWFGGSTHLFINDHDGNRIDHKIFDGYLSLQRLLNLKAFL